jgi:hypothetical protein
MNTLEVAVNAGHTVERVIQEINAVISEHGNAAYVSAMEEAIACLEKASIALDKAATEE